MHKATTFTERLQTQKLLLRKQLECLAEIEGAQFLMSMGWHPDQHMQSMKEGINKYCEATEDFINEINSIADFFETGEEIKKELATPLPTLIA